MAAKMKCYQRNANMINQFGLKGLTTLQKTAVEIYHLPHGTKQSPLPLIHYTYDH